MSWPDERTWAVLAHLAPLLGGFVGPPVLGPLVVYLVYKDRSPYVRRHAAAALNFQIMLVIVALTGATVGLLAAVVLLAALGLVLLLLVLLVVVTVSVGALVLQVMGAVAAHRGQEFRYPLAPQLVR